MFLFTSISFVWAASILNRDLDKSNSFGILVLHSISQSFILLFHQNSSLLWIPAIHFSLTPLLSFAFSFRLFIVFSNPAQISSISRSLKANMRNTNIHWLDLRKCPFDVIIAIVPCFLVILRFDILGFQRHILLKYWNTFLRKNQVKKSFLWKVSLGISSTW